MKEDDIDNLLISHNEDYNNENFYTVIAEHAWKTIHAPDLVTEKN